MVQDGPRLLKLKEVYKKAVQETLKKEDEITSAMTGSDTKDSFYSESSAPVRQDVIRKVFSELKSQFAEVFKHKIRVHNLDLKLNALDRDIKEARVCCQDIRDPAYIREIFHSFTTDQKEELVRAAEEALAQTLAEQSSLERGLGAAKETLAGLISSNAENEAEYQSILRELDAAADTVA